MKIRHPFLAAFAATFTTVLAVVATVNYTLDVGSAYHQDRSRLAEYVRALLRSPTGLVHVPYELERLSKAELTRTVEGADCYVTGSSHELSVRRDTVPALAEGCRALANLAVSGGSFEEFVAFAALAAEKPGVRHIVVGVAPWMLKPRQDERWSTIAAEYAAGRRNFGLADLAIKADDRLGKKLTNLVSFAYLRANLRSLGRAAPKDEFFTGEFRTAFTREDEITLPDGSMVYSQVLLDTSPPPVESVGSGTYRLAEPFIDETVAGEFATALRQLKQQGVAVTLLLMPYHPKVLTCSAREVCAAFAQVEQRVRALAAETGVTVVGGFDPRPFGLGPQDFIDDMHVLPQAVARVWRPAKDQRRAGSVLGGTISQ